MKKFKTLSNEFVLSVGLLLTTFFIFQAAVLPSIVPGDNLAATATRTTKDTFKIERSKINPEAFVFNYKFDSHASASKKGEKSFDLPIIPFDRKSLSKNMNEAFAVTDEWGYPVRENAFMKGLKGPTKRGGDTRSDEDPNVPGQVNCRENESVTGYFKAYFEDVALDNGVGYADGVFGPGRREEVCNVLQDIAHLIKLDETDVTPDIIFMAGEQNIPSGALAAASAYFGYYQGNPDNGSLHKHIIDRIDSTSGVGEFDALVMTNFSGVSWDVDSNLNSGTFDFYTVMYHEVMHALGFHGLLPSVINTTSNQYLNDSFDTFSYRDTTLQNKFVDDSTGVLNVPDGSPSPWFTTNGVVYAGHPNIPNASIDGIRPVYSPSGWQEGSSLSHFDMARSNGEVYVMHPSIGPNVQRTIHQHEKQVLCHLGYQVDGMNGCDMPTPFAHDDTFTPVSGCVDFMLNDESFTGGNLSIESFESLELQNGDGFAFKQNTGCGGQTLGSYVGANSIWFSPGTPLGNRLFKYSVTDAISNRVSFPAYISNMSPNNICVGVSEDEFICNGDFEQGYLLQPVNIHYGQVMQACPSNVPSWCDQVASVDIYDRSLDFYNMWTSYGPESHDGPPNDRYLGGLCASHIAPIPEGGIGWCENSYASAKEILPPGDYSLSFYAIAMMFPTTTVNPSMWVYLTDTEPAFSGNEGEQYTPLPQDISIEIPLNPTEWGLADQSDWGQYLQNISIPDNGTHYRYIVFDYLPRALMDLGQYWNMGRYFLDDVHLVRSGTVTLSGNVYQDVNQNGLQDLGETGLSGVGVSLFAPGQVQPLQTSVTQGIPHLGIYEFTVADPGESIVALANESSFSGITHPAINSLLQGHPHAEQVLYNGEDSTHNDFGVVLGGVYSEANLHLKKSLTDASLSLFDRNITWRVEVTNAGPQVAHNIDIQDAIPMSLIYYSHILQSSDTYSPYSGMWHIPQLNLGETRVLQITMKVPIGTCGIKTNIAELISFDGVDADPTDNTATALIKLRHCGNQIESVK